MSRNELHDGRFELLSSLGEGGFGTVYEAFDRSQRSRVALKALTRLGADALFRFKREFRALQDLSHPNLVSLGELFESQGQWFFTMELVHGEDFMSYVRPQERVVDELRLRNAMIQLAEGLNVLHAADKIHRDIKPSNVRVTPEGRVVILDFGLVVHGSESKQSTAAGVMGSVAYMAPEQAAGGRLGPAADWYSVGTVLYEALTLKLPFDGSPIEILMRKQNETPPRPCHLAPLVPTDLDELCMKLLSPEPFARPSGAEVLTMLRKDSSSSSSSLGKSGSIATGSTFAPPFLGREREISRLYDSVTRVKRGELSTLYVHGPSGIGKSALVRQFAEDLEAREANVLVLSGRCYERETVPYKAFDGVIDELSRYMRRIRPDDCTMLLPRYVQALSRVFPVLSRVEPVARAAREVRVSVDRRAQRDEAFGALREMLVRLSDRVVLVIVIDDWQWADGDSLLLLEAMLSGSDAPACLFICTGREPSECSPEIQASIAHLINAAPLGQQVAVGPLAPTDARELAERMLLRYGGDPKLASAIARETEGQPLFVDELARHAATAHGTGRATDLDAMLRVRLLELSVSSREMLDVLSVAGALVSREVLARAVGAGPSDVTRDINTLKLARLVRTTQQRERASVEIFHDRVRQVALSALSPTQIKGLHAQLARAFEADESTDPNTIAEHWLEAGDVERAAKYALLGSDKAHDVLAFERSARVFRRVLDQGPSPAQERQLLVRLGETLANAGRGAEAADAFLEALEGAAPAEQIVLKRRAAQELIQTGHIDRGLNVAKELLASVGIDLPSTPGAALRSLVWNRLKLGIRGLDFKERDLSEVAPPLVTQLDTLWSMTSALAVVDHVRAADLQTRLILAALKSGEPHRAARALALEALLIRSADPGNDKVGAACITRAREIGTRLDDPHVLGLTDLASGMLEFACGNLSLALDACDRAAATFRERCVGVTWERNQASYFGVLSLFYMGAQGELKKRIPALLRDAHERHDLWAITSFELTAGYHLALVDGDNARATKIVDDAIASWSPSGFHVQHFLELNARAAIFAHEGSDEAAAKAWDFIERRWPELERSQLLRAEIIRWICLWDRSRIALWVAHRDEAKRARCLRVARRDAQALEKTSSPLGRAWGKAIRACLISHEGQREEAATLLAQAALEMEQRGALFFGAAIRFRLGELTRAETSVASARAVFSREGVADCEAFVRMMAPSPVW